MNAIPYSTKLICSSLLSCILSPLALAEDVQQHDVENSWFSGASLAFDPISAVSGLSPFQKSGWAIDAEYFWTPKHAVEIGFQNFEAEFADLNKTALGQAVEGEVASTNGIHSTELQKWSLGYKLYADENDGWYLAGRLVGRRVQIAASINESVGKLDSRAAGPELGGGYRWIFRHGGFCSLGAGLTYWRTTSANTTWSQPLSLLNPNTLDQQVLNAVQAQAYEIGPALLLRLGYVFR